MKKEVKNKFIELTNKRVISINEINTPFSTTYKINDAYILRLNPPLRDETISFKDEKEAIDKIAPLLISEKVIYLDEVSGTKLSKFIHASFLYSTRLTNLEINHVAKTLKKLHKANLKVTKNFEPLEKLNFYKTYVENDKHINFDYERKLLKEFQKIYSKEDNLILCHNYLRREHLLFKFNSVILVDLRYASNNSPLYDLASFIEENYLDYEQKEYFLKVYFGAKLNSTIKKKIDTFIRFIHIYDYYQSLYLGEITKKAIYFKIANLKLNEIEKDLI